MGNDMKNIFVPLFAFVLIGLVSIGCGSSENDAADKVMETATQNTPTTGGDEAASGATDDATASASAGESQPSEDTGSAEADAKRLAELYCRSANLAKKAQTDMSVLQESLELAQEVTKLTETFKTKYSSGASAEVFSRVYLEGIAGCN